MEKNQVQALLQAVYTPQKNNSQTSSINNSAQNNTQTKNTNQTDSRPKNNPINLQLMPAMPAIETNDGKKQFKPRYTAQETYVSPTDLLGESNFNGSQEPTLLARNGYGRLSELASRIQETQVLLARGMSCSNSSLAQTYHSATRKIAGLFGREYSVPDLRETVSLQLSQVREYGACINEIIAQTNHELKSTHAYVGSLAKDVLKLNDVTLQISRDISGKNASDELRELDSAISSINQGNHGNSSGTYSSADALASFVQEHDNRIESFIKRSDYIVGQRATQRKKEYLKHAYSVELLLIGSLTTAKKLGVDARCYASMLERLSSTYFNLGCNSSQLEDIVGGIQTMQEFTDTMQKSVAKGLQGLESAMKTKRTTVGPYLEKAVYSMD